MWASSVKDKENTEPFDYTPPINGLRKSNDSLSFPDKCLSLVTEGEPSKRPKTPLRTSSESLNTFNSGPYVRSAKERQTTEGFRYNETGSDDEAEEAFSVCTSAREIKPVDTALYCDVINQIFAELPEKVEEKWSSISSLTEVAEFLCSCQSSLRENYEMWQSDNVRDFLDTKFKELRRICAQYIREEQDPDFGHNIALSDMNIAKNRLKVPGFNPFDYNGIARSNGEDYVHASALCYEGQQYIAAQGPLTDTLSDFTKMILYSSCQTVISLVEKVEEGEEKCYPYWELFLEGESKTVTDQYVNQRVDRGVLNVPDDFETKEIEYFHFRRWPDQDAPHAEIIDQFMQILLSQKQIGPLVVHCSKGLGRTGTFILLHALLKKIHDDFQANPSLDLDNYSLNIFSILLRLRLQRSSFVQTISQVECVFKAVSRFYEILKAKQKESLVL